MSRFRRVCISAAVVVAMLPLILQACSRRDPPAAPGGVPPAWRHPFYTLPRGQSIPPPMPEPPLNPEVNPRCVM